MATLSRAIKDELNLVRTSLPAQNTSANGTSLDLGNVPMVHSVHLSLLIPATPNLADTQTITGKIQDSADNVTFADLPIGTLTVTGAGGVGAAAASLVQRTPLACRRYVRAVWTASATAGNNTAIQGEFALTF